MSGPESQTATERSARGAWIMVGSLLLLGCVMGVFAFASYSHSEQIIVAKYDDYAKRGAALSARECVSDVLRWFENDCDGIPELCLKGVEEATERCLAATDRLAECDAMKNPFPSSKWAFQQCTGHGIDKASKRPLKKSCTAAYRQLDHFCKRTIAGLLEPTAAAAPAAGAAP